MSELVLVLCDTEFGGISEDDDRPEDTADGCIWSCDEEFCGVSDVEVSDCAGFDCDTPSEWVDAFVGIGVCVRWVLSCSLSELVLSLGDCVDASVSLKGSYA